MDFLARDTVDLPAEVWEGIDQIVRETAGQTLMGRRFLQIYGPLGAGFTAIHVDEADVEEVSEDGFVRTAGRRMVELPLVQEDFWLTWRNLEAAVRLHIPVDYTQVRKAARQMAMKEDTLIFFGSDFLGTEGLLNADGVTHLVRDDWGEGENAFRQVAEGLAMFSSQFLIGRYTLIVSPDVYASLHRIQPGLGMTEADRLRSMLRDRLYLAPILGPGKAVLLCPEPENMDLVIGKDMETAYLETAELNHHFRIVESVALRLKNKDAVIVFD